MRSPFIEITVGNAQDRTDVIEDAKKNPNFPHPLMTFPDVQLPNTLYYAAPITLNLHDKRFFGIKPLIGTCTIKNIAKYMTVPPKPVRMPKLSINSCLARLEDERERPCLDGLRQRDQRGTPA